MFRDEDIEYFWANVDKKGPDECWFWKRSKKPSIYGVFYPRGRKGKRKQNKAHRFSLELALGRPIKPGLFCLHGCDTPACVNPNHLREGTQQDNVKDMRKRGRAVDPPRSVPWVWRFPERVIRGEAHYRAKLTDELVREILGKRMKGEAYKALGRQYGMDQSTIADMCKGKIWKHIHGKDGAPTVSELANVPICVNQFG